MTELTPLMRWTDEEVEMGVGHDEFVNIHEALSPLANEVASTTQPASSISPVTEVTQASPASQPVVDLTQVVKRERALRREREEAKERLLLEERERAMKEIVEREREKIKKEQLMIEQERKERKSQEEHRGSIYFRFERLYPNFMTDVELFMANVSRMAIVRDDRVYYALTESHLNHIGIILSLVQEKFPSWTITLTQGHSRDAFLHIGALRFVKK
jgi:flagellar biosynthesis GTPase FlhF